MADRKISDLTALTTPASGDYLPIVDISEAAAASKNKRITIEELMRGVPDGTAAAPGIAFETDPNTGIYSPGADQLAVATNGTGRLFIDASGNIKVSTGEIFQTSATGYIRLDGGTGSGTGANLIVFGESHGSAPGRIALSAVGTGAVVAQTGGAERLRITAAGLVGIGTSVARGLLTSQPSAGITVTYDDASGDAFFISNQNITGGSGNFGGGITWSKPENAGTARVASIASVQTAGDTDQCGLAFFTKASASNAADLQESLRVTHDGKVGIGTTSPTNALLHVSSSVSGASIKSEDTGGTGSFVRILGDASSQNLINWKTGTSLRFATSDDNFGSFSERFRCDSSGRLLVGTSTSNSLFASAIQVAGAGSAGTQLISGFAANSTPSVLYLAHSRSGAVGTNTILQNNDGIGYIDFYGANGTSYDLGARIGAEVDGTPGVSDMPSRLVFSTTADGAATPTERMRISQNGNTGFLNGSTVTNTIGINSPDASSSSKYLILGNRGASTTLNNTGTSIFQVRTDGGIANFSANDANLSDRNSKKDISLAADTWNCVKEWEIVNYRYKDQSDDANLNFGIIAQQVAESCPEVITIFEPAKESKVAVLDEEGNEVEPAQEAQPEKLGVKEQQMYWMAIKALQEAQVRIETLEAKVAALETP